MAEKKHLQRYIREAMEALETDAHNIVKAYHDFNSKWDDDEPSPLEDADTSIDFFKNLDHVQKGIRGLRKIVDTISQKKLI